MESTSNYAVNFDEQSGATIEVSNYCTFNGKKVMAVRPNLRTNASTVPERRGKTNRASLNESSSDIFSLQWTTAKTLQTQAVTICEIEPIGPSAKESNARYWGPICYIKHRNLDVRPLTFFEQLRLARVHYLTTANGIRLFLILFFLAWFIFNAVTIWKDFRWHEGIVYLEYQTPIKSHPPGITICTHCVLCAFKNESTVHADYILNNDSTWNANNSTNQNDSMKDFEVKCRVFSSTYEPPNKQNTFDCMHIAPVVKSMEEGHKCFTYFSNIYGNRQVIGNSTDLSQLKFDQVPVIRFEINGKFLYGKSTYRFERVKNSIHKSSWGDMSEDRSGNSYSGIYVTLHDPDVLPDMFSLQYYRMQVGKIMVIPFRKRIQKLKPTMSCFSYRSDHSSLRPDELNIRTLYQKDNESTEQDLSLYRSRGECFLYCLWRMLNAKRCTNLFSIFTLELVQQEQYYRRILREWFDSKSHKIKDDTQTDENRSRVRFCKRSLQSYQSYLLARHKCMLFCPSDCTLESYAEESVFNYAYQGKTNASYLEVAWSRQPVTYVEHRSKMDTQEFLGSIGGQAHIWLGISIPYLIGYVIKLIQWGEFLPHHTCCCVLTWWRSCFVRATNRHRHRHQNH